MAQPSVATSLLSPEQVRRYCDRIGYTGSLDVSLVTLIGLHVAHTQTVPFENLDIHLGRALSLDPAHLFSKIVSEKRGGYCYEVNGLFALLCETLGFKVTRLAARVRFGYDVVRPRSHQLSLVTVDNNQWIADVGFGLHGLRSPLPFVPGVAEQQEMDTFSIRSDGAAFYLQKLFDSQWQDLYSFSLDPYLPVDFVPLNYWTSMSPESMFTHKKICSMATPAGRNVAVDMEFKIRSSGSTETIQATSPEEYVRLLDQYFGLKIDAASLP